MRSKQSTTTLTMSYPTTPVCSMFLSRPLSLPPGLHRQHWESRVLEGAPKGIRPRLALARHPWATFELHLLARLDTLLAPKLCQGGG